MSNSHGEGRSKWTPAQLHEKLREQIYFLRSSSEALDAGVNFEAARIAATIRTLLHQTNNSHALLVQMDLRDRMQFLDQSIRGRQFFRDGLLELAIEVEYADGRRELLPGTPQDGLADIHMIFGVRTYVPAFRTTDTPTRFVSFDDWWTTKFIDISRDKKMSRRDLVLEVANRDGGSHIDPKGTTAAYSKFRREGHGVRWSNEPWEAGPGSSEIMNFVKGDAVASSLRHMAHELIETLKIYGAITRGS